jgi:type II secretory pathway predicted ATPase ExeA
MYLDYFNLREKPFGLTPDPKFLFFSEQHREALDHLLYGIRQREGFVLISGDPGTGKTTLCRALLERLDSREASSSLILNPLLSEEELLRAILEDFGLQPGGGTRKELLDQLRHFLLETSASGKTAVLIIDEAQNLSTSCLEQVRLLSNLETEKEKLIQIVLVGSEELPKTLELPELRHLNQRISVRFHLRPLNEKEMRAYLQHRLNMAGAAGGLFFEQKAYREIYGFSKGVPRLINMIADRTLLAACLSGSRTIKRLHVNQGRASLGGEAAGREPRLAFWLKRRLLPGSVIFFVVTVAGLLLLVPGVRERLERNYLQRANVSSVASARPARTYVRTTIEPSPLERGESLSRPAEGTVAPFKDGRPDGSLHSEDVEQKTEAKISGSARGPDDGGSASLESHNSLVGASQTVVSGRVSGKPEHESLPKFVYKPPYIYTVHVNSFYHKQDAVARARELQDRGFDSWIAWKDLGDKGIWYRVLLGKYSTKDEALAMVRQLKLLKEFHKARQLAVNAAVSSETTKAMP